MEITLPTVAAPGYPELSELGKRLEMLRIERGLSKQQLARHAGTSRQQLWRVMTGKAELTIALRTRLADALAVGLLELDGRAPLAPIPTLTTGAPPIFAEYVNDSAAIVRTLSTFPLDAGGIALKRRFLDAIEDRAMADNIVLNATFFDLRRRVIARDL